MKWICRIAAAPLLLRALIAMCIFSVAPAWSSALHKRWWLCALLSVLG